jgi:hypothetical protein
MDNHQLERNCKTTDIHGDLDTGLQKKNTKEMRATLQPNANSPTSAPTKPRVGLARPSSSFPSLLSFSFSNFSFNLIFLPLGTAGGVLGNVFGIACGGVRKAVSISSLAWVSTFRRL